MFIEFLSNLRRNFKEQNTIKANFHKHQLFTDFTSSEVAIGTGFNKSYNTDFIKMFWKQNILLSYLRQLLNLVGTISANTQFQ